MNRGRYRERKTGNVFCAAVPRGGEKSALVDLRSHPDFIDYPVSAFHVEFAAELNMVRTAKQFRDMPAIVESAPDNGGVVDPIASLGAMDTLMSVVPNGTVSGDLPLFPTRKNGISRFRRAFLTGFPLLIADVAVSFGIQFGFGVAAGLGGVSMMTHAQAVLFFCGSCVLLARFLGLYPGTGMNPVAVLRLQTHAVLFATLISIVAASATAWVTIDQPLVFLLGAIVCGLLMPSTRSIVRRKVAAYQWWGERAVIVGTTRNSLAICDFLQANAHLGLRSIGVVDDAPADYWGTETSHDIPFLGLTDELLDVCRARDAHWVIVTIGGRDQADIDRVLTVCSLVPNMVVANDDLALPSLWCHSFDAAGVAGFRVKDRLLHPLVRVAKRLIDVTLSAVLLLLLSPLLLLIAATVTTTSRGPIFFGDQRVGRGGKLFAALKFRTMVDDSDRVFREHLRTNPTAKEEWERTQKLVRDPRVIPVIGNMLRRWSLDELPQLINVLRGDMSLVGPRPIMPDEVVKYESVYRLYTRVRPGLTGLWQVSGRNRTSYNARLQLVSYYVRSWSLWLDYYILLRTVKTVLTRQGSY